MSRFDEYHKCSWLHTFLILSKKVPFSEKLILIWTSKKAVSEFTLSPYKVYLLDVTLVCEDTKWYLLSHPRVLFSMPNSAQEEIGKSCRAEVSKHSASHHPLLNQQCSGLSQYGQRDNSILLNRLTSPRQLFCTYIDKIALHLFTCDWKGWYSVLSFSFLVDCWQEYFIFVSARFLAAFINPARHDRWKCSSISLLRGATSFTSGDSFFCPSWFEILRQITLCRVEI